MLQATRHKLHGRYKTPRFRYGAVVEDAIRGPVRIVGLTGGRIPWPIGTRVDGSGRARGLILYGALARAVQRESNLAVAYWFGVTGQTVTKWRRALGVDELNDGSHKLKVEFGKEPWFKRARRKAWSKARDPDRRAKIAAAKRGKSRPAHVIEAVRQAHLWTRHSGETRAYSTVEGGRFSNSLLLGAWTWTRTGYERPAMMAMKDAFEVADHMTYKLNPPQYPVKTVTGGGSKFPFAIIQK